MTDEKGKKGGQKIASVGVAGVIVGAAVGGATAWALSNEKNRKKVQQEAQKVGGYIKDRMKEARGRINVDKMKKDVESATDTAEEKIKATTDTQIDEMSKE